MWLYVPSTSSRSAREDVVSIGPLSWQSQLLAQSCTWRGKHSPSLHWSRRLKTASWLRRLSGAMCEPSRAAPGAASWMGSLAASRASLTALPGAAVEAPTSGTSGARPAGSSPRRGRGSSSSKMSAASSRRGLTKSLAPIGYDETYESWVSRLRAASSARRTWASRMNARGSSSSAWPTPRASEGNQDFAKFERSNTGPALPALAIIQSATIEDRSGTAAMGSRGSKRSGAWSTPRASDGEKVGPNQSFGAGGVPLVAQATNWATPSVADVMGGRKARSGERSAEMLNNSLAPMVTDDVWPTPTSLSFAGSHQPGNSRSYNETMRRAAGLAFALLGPEIPTPGASSPISPPTFYQRYRSTTDSSLRCEMRGLRRMSRDRRPISIIAKDKDGQWQRVRPAGWTSGPASLFVRPAFRRQLNARFVEWLMSWPPGLTSYACSEMALQTHKADWRSELASMTSLPSGPPAQLSLFA